IRTSSDHSSVDSSPRPIAASHVLHRLLMPRHPPCALTHLFTTRCSHPLCNTQHTTTHPNHQTTTTPTSPERDLDALDSRSGRRPENNTHPNNRRLSSQDPTACRTPTTNPAPPRRTAKEKVVVFHPATHRPKPVNGIRIRRTHQPAPPKKAGRRAKS